MQKEGEKDQKTIRGKEEMKGGTRQQWEKREAAREA